MFRSYMVSIWLVRNDVQFNREDADVNKVVDLIMYKSWSWLKSNKLDDFSYSFYVWSKEPSYCLENMQNKSSIGTVYIDAGETCNFYKLEIKKHKKGMN